MDVFNKIYSQVSYSVSSTVSHLSGVLPGNPVTREFDAQCHIASAGPGLLWKVYKGNKRSTKQEASIFVFEKRQLERWNKVDREIILDVLRRGVTQLTKIRHPQILIVQHPLEESRESLAFAAEPIFASLANILGQTTNMPQPANISDYKLYDVEIKYGLLQISEGLTFLHNDVKLLHKNICPESIMINSQGAWKIFGFDFCVHNTSPPNATPFYPLEEYSPTLPNVCQPNLDYMAPECVLNKNHTTASDIFSLGLLAFSLHSRDGQVISPIKDLSRFKERAQQFKNLNTNKLQCVPEELREHVKVMLGFSPHQRPDAHQFVKISYFNDVGVKTLTYLDSLLQWDNLQKSQFYRGLPEALSKLPQRVKIQRVLTCLNRDLAQPIMVPFILPSIFEITKECNQNEFVMYILPNLKPVMKLTEPIQVLVLLLQNMELLLKLTPPDDVQQHVLPMLYRGLDSDSPQIHELCLSVLPTFAGLLEHTSVKNSLLPRIKRLCLSTSSLSVRVNCLLCIGRLLEHLDKWLVLDEILPFLPQIPSREPAVLMGILGIYKLSLNHKKLGISKEVIATRILPFLMPLCIENGLTLQQFNALVALVKQMFQLVETEHRTKLEQLNSVHEQHKVLESTMPTISPNSKVNELDQVFTGLGLDTFVTNPVNEQNKSRIVPQQETTNIFTNQTTLTPKSITYDTPTVQTKDLSFTLEQSNVSLLNPNQSFIPLSSQNVTTSQGWNSSNNLNVNNSLKSPLSSQNVTTSQGWNSSNNLNVNNSLKSFGESNAWSVNVSINPASSSQTSWTNKPSNSTPNWSALDNLLPSASKISLNQIKSQTQPLLPTPSVNINSNNNNNPLSNNDIMDLLS